MGHEHEPETNRSGPRVIGPRVVFGGSRHVLSDWGLGRDVVERYVTRALITMRGGCPPPLPCFLVLDTMRGGHPPLSALFLTLNSTRGGRPPLSPCFLILVTMR